jgi:hypothetical protein
VSRLHVEQGRRHDQEFRRTRQVRRSLHKSDELIGHLGECNLGDVEFFAGNQGQEEIERAFENGE